MQYEVRGMAEPNPRASDTLPRRGRVNEVCREWVVHEDEALAYQLQKQEVEQHYGGNKERNARVREDFPKAKEEQEKEIAEAAKKYKQRIRQQEQIDSAYARRIAERLEIEEHERRRRAEVRDLDAARKMQVYEAMRNSNQMNTGCPPPPPIPAKGISVTVPDVNRVGLPVAENLNFEPMARHQTSFAVTHSLRKLRLGDDDNNYVAKVENADPRSHNYSPSCSLQRVNRTPTPATLLPEDVNEIITDVDLQEEANKRLQEEKDEELARMLQKQEEEIMTEEVDKDRLLAIEAQDKELAKLLYEKEKAKLRRAKERARQRALLKKQQEQQSQNTHDQNVTNAYSLADSDGVEVHSGPLPTENIPSSHHSSEHRFSANVHINSDEAKNEDCNHQDDRQFTSTFTGGRTTTGPPIMNVAMHIDPTYLSQQSANMPNSLTFPEGETTAPPYMPIQGQRRNLPIVEKKQKKSKSKDGCKQQ